MSSNLANALRILAIDAVQQARSGHPGMPMGMADIMTVLWRHWLKHNPANAGWPDRDRFVLSNGHGSMLLYAALHLSGYDLSIDDLRNFRQLYSPTPGHPEVGVTAGVEATTGPLGQGFANAIGMAIAEQKLAAQYNHSGYRPVDHHTWVFLGDGCLMEGISHEAASLAGALGLGKLIAIYDDNNISIDGAVSPWFQDDTPARFRAYNWHVIEAVNGHDPGAIGQAFTEAKEETSRPTLICAKTIIGYGSPAKQNTAAVHGAALGEAEVAATRAALKWKTEEAFSIPPAIYADWNCKERGEKLESAWQKHWQDYQQHHPGDAATLERAWSNQLPDNFKAHYEAGIKELLNESSPIATREAFNRCLELAGPLLPELIGGSADLTESCCTRWSGCTAITATEPNGNYLHYGVREFAMSAISNGICLHGGLRPYTGTFLVFSDYARNAIRMASLMALPQMFVYTHDSIGLGEDGPTHQPIEQLTHLRTTPGLSVWRPCDVIETAVALQSALSHSSGPSALVLSRQKLKQQQRTLNAITNISRGGYILIKETAPLQLILIATGSEVGLAVEVSELLAPAGVRVVSMPSVDVFMQQADHWQEEVLPKEISCRLAIEAGHPDCWYRLVGLDGDIIGINTFGDSAPANDLAEAFGLTPDKVTLRAKQLLKQHQQKTD